MIKPVNNHLLIEPLPQESFIASDRTTYQEIGVVIDAADTLLGPTMTTSTGIHRDFGMVKKGDKVYFDSWLAAKFPKNETEYYWLVKWEDVRAVQHAEIPKQPVS